MEGFDGIARSLTGGLLQMFGMPVEAVEAAEVAAPESGDDAAVTGEYTRVLAGGRAELGINDR